ncbi:hypothetical protein [Nocardioides euryhalodurans]|uniref:hypothetical protein n=1 Tax=Nocardioides euryhalodurans TaxID=2518370 RepID=UPI00141FE1FC|nr:hypothetical protein [Nocardioides euryhalodurans]
MSLSARDLVLGTVLLLAFPLSLTVTDAASSEPGAPGAPTREPVPVSEPATG